MKSDIQQELELIYKELTKLRNRVKSLLDDQPKKKIDYTEADKLIDYFNLITKQAYKKTDSTRSLFSARLKEGHTSEDIQSVIFYKQSEWAGTNWAKYLRPSTLLQASKFQGYLEEAKLAKPVREKILVNFV